MNILLFSFFFFFLSLTRIQCQTISVQFATFPVNTDIGVCTCDLTANACDVSCCCDSDCTASDKTAFGCSTRANQFTNSTSAISTVQPNCFKNSSIFSSDSPYIIQKMGELVCLDYVRYTASEYYQQPQAQTINADDFVRAINAEDSVSALPTLSTNLTSYQVGTPILAYSAARNTPIFYSLPVNILNNAYCSGSQSITYMNNFISTCIQPVTRATCSGALNPITYSDSWCFFRSPAGPYDSTTRVCNSPTIQQSVFSTSSCSGALQSLTITVYYSNPTGIGSINVALSTDTASTSSFIQTFRVTFIESPSPSSSNTIRNPGYLSGANLIAGTTSGSTITVDSTKFSILQPLPSGTCSTTNSRMPIVFGKDIQSACSYSVATQTTCPDLTSLLAPTTSSALYVAAYSNSNPTNISDWLPVISCTSAVGSSNNYACQSGTISTSNSDSCYVKLDIQVAYTKIGTLINPQYVLSAVIFHYQYVAVTATSTLPSTLLVMQSVTFQDISTASVIQQGHIPTPNTRLPTNFFYPFSTSHAAKFTTFPSFSYLYISVLFILM